MSSGLQNAITRTRVLAGLSKARESNDRQLLEQFAGGDETAFTALVDRYGGLVLGVCRRVLQHTQDAEDAFQATFMVLAKKAGKIVWQDSVANWLHGVACRIAFQVRREKARHQSSERMTDEPVTAAADPTWSDLKPVLDEELNRLPAKFRLPLILCCLEGKSRDEAATQLGWSVGSLKGRLERGREILRSRLAKRGLALSAALAATLLTAAGAQAAVPLTLGIETVRAGMAMLAGQTTAVVSTQALTLAQGALHAMFMSKLKFAAAVVLTVLTVGLGAGYVTHQALAGADIAEVRNNNTPVGAANASEFVSQREGREERKQPPTVSGIVEAVNDKKIDILVGRRDPVSQSFEVAKDVKILQREGRDLTIKKLADVQPKLAVTLILDDAKKVVTIIEIQGERAPDAPGERGGRDDGRTFRGHLAEIDLAKKTMSFHSGGRGEPVKVQTFDIAKDVKVVIRTGRLVKDGKIEDVQPKTNVEVRLDETKKIIQTITITISTTAYGTVSEVDAKSITLTASSRDGEGKSETYAMSKDVKVQYRLPGQGGGREGAPGALKELKRADLPAKAVVTVQLDDERKVVQTIDVQLPHVSGALQDVDAKKGTLLLKMVRGAELGLTVEKDAKILINGKEGKLDSIAVGAEAQLILTPDRTRVLYLRTPPAEGREE